MTNNIFLSLQGIHKHKFTHVLTEPGKVDLSADVDFEYLKQATEELGKYLANAHTFEIFFKSHSKACDILRPFD
jgi:SAM-dependent MidA family methyltransferase